MGFAERSESIEECPAKNVHRRVCFKARADYTSPKKIVSIPLVLGWICSPEAIDTATLTTPDRPLTPHPLDANIRSVTLDQPSAVMAAVLPLGWRYPDR